MMQPQKPSRSDVSNDNPNLQSPLSYQSRQPAPGFPSAMQPTIPTYDQYPPGGLASPGVGSKSYLVAFLFSLFLGALGADRFYLGYVGTGVLKLLSLGGLGIWYLIDLVMVYSGHKRAKDGSPLSERERDKKTATIFLVVMLLVGLALNVYFSISAASFFKALDKGVTITSENQDDTFTIRTPQRKPEADGGAALTLLGSRAMAEKYAIAVTKSIESPQTIGDTPDTGTQYLQIDLSLTNTGGEDSFVPGSFFYKTSTGEELFTADTFGNQGSPNKNVRIDGRQSMTAAFIPAGKTDDNRSLIFQIPQGDKGHLVWRNETLDPNGSVFAIFQLF